MAQRRSIQLDKKKEWQNKALKALCILNILAILAIPVTSKEKNFWITMWALLTIVNSKRTNRHQKSDKKQNN